MSRLAEPKCRGLTEDQPDEIVAPGRFAKDAQNLRRATLLHQDWLEIDVQRAGREQLFHDVLEELRRHVVDVCFQENDLCRLGRRRLGIANRYAEQVGKGESPLAAAI